MAREKKRKYRVVWSQTYTCSKVVEARSENEAQRLAYESMDAEEPDTKELDSTHDWSVVAEDELNPPE